MIPVNVKVHAQKETELMRLVQIDEQEIFHLRRVWMILNEDIVVLSGSLATSLPIDFYEQLLPTIREAGAEFAIDTTGEALLQL